MLLEVKDFEELHRQKIKNGLDCEKMHTQYFFCIDNRMLFIKKSRRFYKVMASGQCGFEPAFRESCLDVLYVSTDIVEAIKMFESYVVRLCQ